MNRRTFMMMTLAACAAPGVQPKAADTPPPAPAKKKVRVLGGTGYIGPHIVRRSEGARLTTTTTTKRI